MILSWFFMRSYLFASFSVLILVTAVVFLGDLVYMVRETESLSLATGTVALLSALRLPELVLIDMLPITTVIGSTVASISLIRSRVMLIFESMGGSLWMLLTGPFFAMLGMGVVVLLGLNPLSTFFYNWHVDILSASETNAEQLGISRDEMTMWLHTQHERQRENLHLVVRMQGLHPLTGRITQGVNILYFDAQHRLTKKIQAQEAQISGGTWQMFSVEIEQIPASSVEQRSLVLLTGMPTLADIVVQPRLAAYRLSFFALPGYIAKAKEIGVNASLAQRRWHVLCSLPFLLVSTMLCGLYFTARVHHRSGGAVQALVWSLVFSVGLFFVQRLFAFMALSGMLTPLLSVWGLPAIIGFCALGLLMKRYENV